MYATLLYCIYYTACRINFFLSSENSSPKCTGSNVDLDFCTWEEASAFPPCHFANLKWPWIAARCLVGGFAGTDGYMKGQIVLPWHFGPGKLHGEGGVKHKFTAGKLSSAWQTDFVADLGPVQGLCHSALHCELTQIWSLHCALNSWDGFMRAPPPKPQPPSKRMRVIIPSHLTEALDDCINTYRVFWTLWTGIWTLKVIFILLYLYPTVLPSGYLMWLITFSLSPFILTTTPVW